MPSAVNPLQLTILATKLLLSSSLPTTTTRNLSNSVVSPPIIAANNNSFDNYTTPNFGPHSHHHYRYHHAHGGQYGLIFLRSSAAIHSLPTALQFTPATHWRRIPGPHLDGGFVLIVTVVPGSLILEEAEEITYQLCLVLHRSVQFIPGWRLSSALLLINSFFIDSALDSDRNVSAYKQEPEDSSRTTTSQPPKAT